jgi:hypothetical protein
LSELLGRLAPGVEDLFAAEHEVLKGLGERVQADGLTDGAVIAHLLRL